MKHLNADELKVMESTKVPLTQKECRARAVEVMKAAARVTLLQDYEYGNKKSTMTCGAFEVLAADKVLQVAGLKGATVADIRKTMGYTEDQIHAVFCYCHNELEVTTSGSRLANLMSRIG